VTTHISVDAVDLLEREDLELRRIFTQLQGTRGESVEERAEYGDLAKQAIHHMATREAAVVEVARVVADVPGLESVATRLTKNTGDRRTLHNAVEKKSRGVQPINLNTGQDFDEDLQRLIQLIGTEMEWELEEAVPVIKGSLAVNEQGPDLKSAGHVARHAPTSLSPSGPKWFERAPVISRALTIYDRLRDFPRARRR
jgi:hypothetical protein